MKKYKTASCRIEIEEYAKYLSILAGKNTVPNEDIKKYIESVIENGKKETIRSVEGENSEVRTTNGAVESREAEFDNDID